MDNPYSFSYVLVRAAFVKGHEKFPAERFCMAFGPLLRRLRVEAGLSQEALAERARVSTAAIGAYERGARSSPHRDTIRMLADALVLTDSERLDFEIAARRKPRAPNRRSADDPQSTQGGLSALPLDASSFVGRAREIEEVKLLLTKHRLVTLTGPAGVGKTRLALFVARSAEPAYRDGVFLIDLAPIRDAQTGIPTIASVLNVPAQTVDSIASAMKERQTLIVLDNCEHLVDVVGDFAAAILRQCSTTRIITTSRRRVRVAGEAVYRLEALAFPIAGPVTIGELRSCPATQLFIDRAETADSRFRVSDANATSIADICRYLDGIPLAIELSAMRLPLLGMAGLRQQLGAIAHVSSGSRDLSPRHHTLRSTLIWSLNLLDATARQVFRRLATFSGGWTLGAAEYVCVETGIARHDAIEALASLVELSILNVDLEAAVTRYSMHSITYALARDELEESADYDTITGAHARWVLSIAEDLREKPNGAHVPRRIWHERYDCEIDNVRAALRAGLSGSLTPYDLARIISSFVAFWSDNGFLNELRGWIDAANLLAIEAKSLRAQALLAVRIASMTRGHERLESALRAIELCKACDETYPLAVAHFMAAISYDGDQNAAAEMRQHYASAISIFQSSGFGKSISMAYALLWQGTALTAAGDDGRSSLEAALALSTALDEAALVQHAQNMLAEVDFSRGDVVSAISRLTACLNDSGCLPPRDRMYMLCNRAGYFIVEQKFDLAFDDAKRALSLAHDSDTYVSTFTIEHLANAAAHFNEAELAATLHGFVDHAIEVSGFNREQCEQRCRGILVSALERALPKTLLDRHVAEGAALPYKVAVRKAMQFERPALSNAKRQPSVG